MEDSAEWNQSDLLARAQRLRKVLGGTSGLSKGRVVRAYGWHRFRPHVAVAEMLLHVESRAPLLITRFNAATDLIENERWAVRSFLISCCLDIAAALQETVGIDSGWLDWKVPERYAGAVCATSPGFKPTQKGTRPLRRGTYVILRRT